MVGQIKTVNGVKKIVPLTAEARAGNPVSTIIAIYSNLVPYGYLPCNGVQFDETQFPALYAILGDNHTPDLRECALVGAGQNTTDTIATHDVYNIGQFKDDQLQDHTHSVYYQGVPTGAGFYAHSLETQTLNSQTRGVGPAYRHGNVTRGKRKGVNYCIKATAGLDESDADYVLGVLAPVDEVAVDNMHSVTSNAVYNVLNKKDYNTVLDQSINARSFETTINQSGFYNISVKVYTTDDNDRFIYIALDSQTIARMKITGTLVSQHLNTSTFIKAGTKLRFVSNDSSNVMIVDAYVCRVIKCEIF